MGDPETGQSAPEDEQPTAETAGEPQADAQDEPTTPGQDGSGDGIQPDTKFHG